MSNSLANRAGESPRLCVDEVRPRMAKAVLNSVDEDAGRRKWGQILSRAVKLAGLIDSEAAGLLGVEKAQFSRWLTGKENAQTWRFHEHDLLGPALIAAQAEVTEGASVRTVIELRRKVG